MNQHKTVWHSDLWKPKDIKVWDGARGGIVDTVGIVRGHPNIMGMTYATLFAYMFRRFGWPEWGCDPHEDLAMWFITTPNKNVALIVNPKPSGIELSFGYMIRIHRYAWRNEEHKREIADALTCAMYDLLSPVYIRDCPINAAGRINDFNRPVEGFPLFDDCVVDRWKWAGYGVSEDYFVKRFESP